MKIYIITIQCYDSLPECTYGGLIYRPTVSTLAYRVYIDFLYFPDAVTNEKGEIRCCNLVATKSHAQYESALQELRKSLELYGLQAPSLFYTDNVIADKGFLEGIYPSLREDVVPIEKYSNLEPLVVPPNIQVFLKNTRPSINDALSTILDDLPSANSEKILHILLLDLTLSGMLRFHQMEMYTIVEKQLWCKLYTRPESISSRYTVIIDYYLAAVLKFFFLKDW